MDRENLHDVQRMHGSKAGKAKIMLFGEFAGKKRAEEVEDPYYVRGYNSSRRERMERLLNIQKAM
jgi:protein-tyrosine-phosphatase